jgi:hypothetical protein
MSMGETSMGEAHRGGPVKRRLLLKLGLLALLAIIGFVVIVWPRINERITEENFKQVQKGMTEQEVRDILGPPGVYTARAITGKYFISWNWPTGAELIEKWGGREWVGDDVTVYVLFDEDGRVDHFFLGELDRLHAYERSWLQKLRGWVRGVVGR